jgi:hypothetical protein
VSGRKEPRFGRGFLCYGWRIIHAYVSSDVLQPPSKKKPANAGFFAFNNSYAKNQA